MEFTIVSFVSYLVRTITFLSTFSQFRSYLRPSAIVLLSFCLSVCIVHARWDIANGVFTTIGLEIVFVFMLEAALGVLYALPLAVSLETIFIASRLIDVSRGAHLGEQFIPEIGSGSTSMESLAHVFIAFGLVSFVSTQSILLGFASIPCVIEVGLRYPSEQMLNAIVFLTGRVFLQGVLLALPVLLLNFLVDIVSLLLSRVIGRINFGFELVPVKLIASLLLLCLCLPYYSEVLAGFYVNIIELHNVLWRKV